MNHRGAAILVVGANKTTRDFVGTILRPEGYALIDANALQTAHIAAAQHAPALIVIELAAAARQGRMLVRMLKSQAATMHIPVIVLHANAGARPRLATLAAGADDIVTQLDAAELRLRVRNLLRLASNNGQPRTALLGLQLADGAIEVAIIDSHPANIGLIDRAGTLVSVNKAWRRFALENGMPPARQFGIGMNYLDVCTHDPLAPGDVSEVGTGIRAVLAGRLAQYTLEYACHAPGRPRWFLLTVAPLGDGPEGAIIMHVDVTQQYLTRQSLRESALQFGQMADNIRDIFFLVDAATRRVLYVSPAYDDILGRPAAALDTRPDAWLDAILPEDRARVTAAFVTHSKRTGDPFECYFQIRRPDLALRWLSVKVVWAREEGGQLTRMAGVAQDITESRNAVRHLRESERRFLELLNNTSMLAVMLDRDAQITFCNHALLSLMGLERERVVGGNWFDVFMASDPTHTKKIFLALLAQGSRASRYEDELIGKDGERRVICWNTSVLHDIHGAIIGTTSIGEDITEQKNAEREIRKLNVNLEKMSSQLVHAQEQERISLARELHDELGQHLALLKIDLYLLRDSLSDAAAHAQWKKIDAEVVALIAKIRAISSALRPPALDYLGLESALRQLLERQFATGACRYVFEYAGLPARLAPPVEIALYRIVQESTTNIVRYARATSVVVELNGGESGRELELLVRDDGVGFDPGAGPEDLLAAGGGNGLRGMAERVQLLGGRFDVASSPVAGTRIAVSLPLAER